MRSLTLSLFVALAILTVACRGEDDGSASGRAHLLPSLIGRARSNADAEPPAVPFDSTTPYAFAQASASWPHDTGAYTQGLIVHRGHLYESVGRTGLSDVREVDRATARVTRRAPLPSEDFGEGLAAVGERLYQLTWRGGRGYIYDAATLAHAGEFAYEGEGWGLASDGTHLYMSDGTTRLRVIDPAGFRVLRTIDVSESGRPVWMLNELEWVRGELWANIYETDLIARIDPTTGHVLGWIDVSKLLTSVEQESVARRGGVANGIAFDSAAGAVLLTGKLWPRLFSMPARMPSSTVRGAAH
jgi:Glutamine cyclotransferase